MQKPNSETRKHIFSFFVCCACFFFGDLTVMSF